MLKNYVKIAFRNLLRHRSYTLINIMGLSIGIACCLLILLYIRSELSYDSHHENAARIYRVGRISQQGDNVRKGARSPVPMGPALKAEFGEITGVIRFWRSFNPILYFNDGFVLFCLAMTVPIVTLLAGYYPALFLSRFRPLLALKGGRVSTTSGGRLRRGLIVFQFIISIVLISGTLMIYNQLEYVLGKRHVQKLR